MAYEQTQDLTKVQAADAHEAQVQLESSAAAAGAAAAEAAAGASAEAISAEGVAPSASAGLVQLVIISGRSGSGKTVALRALEDLGYYCIDNLPVNFLLELTSMAASRYPKLAVSIDIRNLPENDSFLATLINDIKANPKIHSTLIFCDADDQVLIKRYSETRRLHPLSALA